MECNTLCPHIYLIVHPSDSDITEISHKTQIWTSFKNWYRIFHTTIEKCIAISVVTGISYLWLISKALLEEIREHQPDRKDDFLLSWSSITNLSKMFEIFLPVTQVPVLGKIALFE